MISPRDFVVLSRRTDDKYGGHTFIQVSQPDSYPKTKAVRGDIWTVMSIQPYPKGTRNAKMSLCTYGLECQPYIWLPLRAVDMAADDVPLALCGLKQYLERRGVRQPFPPSLIDISLYSQETISSQLFLPQYS